MLAPFGVGAVAREVFEDFFAYDWADERDDYGEEWFNITGMVRGRLITVTYTIREANFASFPPARPNHGNAAATMSKKINKASETFDWSRFDAMTDEDVHAAALADPDARPWTEEQLAKAKRTPRVKVVRRVLKLTQEQFAEQFRIPLGTLRDWEQGRKEPDQAARSYLFVIASDPDAVRQALKRVRQHEAAE